MTKEEKEIALYCLKANSDYHSEVCEECVKYPNCDHTIQDDVTETIIKALEQEPCDDCVSRQAVLNYISRLLNQGTGKKKSFEFIQKYVKKLPPVNPQKIGHWIKEFNDIEGEVRFTCSLCGEYQLFETDFCPDCGAKMAESESKIFPAESESKFFAKLAESYCKGLQDGLTAESEDK